ncbi:MAG TPA: MFS transporter, partial [Candidatus Limnocylindrales bacterium]|nr:MFS transporter [Candidatus Limnocylindrales bacterium]
MTLPVIRLAIALFLVQAGFHGYTASLPLALARADVPDATIGLIVGMAAVVQVPAAIAGGRLVDTFGGLRLFAAGGFAYLLASGILLLPGVEPGGSALPFFAARALQGAGIAATLPAALSLVPRMLPKAQTSNGLAFVGAAHNLTLVLLPPISIAVLDAASFDGVALMVIGFVCAGLLLAIRLPVRPMAHQTVSALGVASRRFGITWRREWLMPLLIVVTYVAHWGAITAYLPVRASEAGADIGLYFAADGLAIFAMRIPTGWLTNHVASRTLILVGAFGTAIAIGMLLLPLTTPLLIVSGLLGGASGALVMTPILIELSHRSSDADRGSAFALFSGGLAAAMSLGSIGGAPIVAVLGMSAALAVGILLIGVSVVLTLSDPSLRVGRGGGPPPDPEGAGHSHADLEP